MPAPRYKWYVVGMLWWICFFNYADRQAIFSVFPLLEKEFGLTLEQLGWLGSSFGLVYGLCAPFVGRVVDRVRRKSAILDGVFGAVHGVEHLGRRPGVAAGFRWIAQ